MNIFTIARKTAIVKYTVLFFIIPEALAFCYCLFGDNKIMTNLSIILLFLHPFISLAFGMDVLELMRGAANTNATEILELKKQNEAMSAKIQKLAYLFNAKDADGKTFKQVFSLAKDASYQVRKGA